MAICIKGPVNVSDEGLHTLSYYAVDRAGNNEIAKDASFGIDMTSLEISAVFDIDAEKFIFSSVGDGNVLFFCDPISCTAVDQAGNTTKLNFNIEQKSHKQFLTIVSVSYNGTEDKVPDNQLAVKLLEKNDELKDFDQTFLIKKEEKVTINYKKKKDQSVIVRKPIPGKLIRETISGKRFLQIFTDRGIIKPIW